MSEADQHLLELIRAGDHDGWNQFVGRFQRRLMGFARQQVGQETTAEDLVQETFVAFLKALDTYRQDCELESFLFQILRRRIVDYYRAQGRNREVPVCSFYGATADAADDPLQTAVTSHMQPSWYARRSETQESIQQALAGAVAQLASWLHSGRRFRDLKIAEGLFYAGIRNRDLATAMNVAENEVNLVKHRLVKRLKHSIAESDFRLDDSEPNDEWFRHLLITTWETQRPSCPKRSTLGKYTLGILPPDWDDFVHFHVKILGCTFCNANLDELSAAGVSEETDSANERIFQSTVGFLNPESRH